MAFGREAPHDPANPCIVANPSVIIQRGRGKAKRGGARERSEQAAEPERDAPAPLDFSRNKFVYCFL
jgi:hypothetical protein